LQRNLAKEPTVNIFVLLFRILLATCFFTDKDRKSDVAKLIDTLKNGSKVSRSSSHYDYGRTVNNEFSGIEAVLLSLIPQLSWRNVSSAVTASVERMKKVSDESRSHFFALVKLLESLRWHQGLCSRRWSLQFETPCRAWE
jgi:hypothetical protein